MSKKTIYQMMSEARENGIVGLSKNAKCEKCGERLSIGWVVCPGCGATIEECVSEKEPVKAPKNQQEGTKMKRFGFRKFEAEEADEIEQMGDELLEDEVEEETEQEETEVPVEDDSITVDEVMAAVQDLVADSGIEVVNEYEKTALCFDLEADDGSTAHVVYDGKSVQFFSDDELVSSMQAETLSDFIAALESSLSEGEEEEGEEIEGEEEVEPPAEEPVEAPAEEGHKVSPLVRVKTKFEARKALKKAAEKVVPKGKKEEKRRACG